MPRLRALVAILALAAAACDSFKEMGASLKDLSTVTAELAKEYHTQPNVVLMNSSHLRITFQNPPEALVSAMAKDREGFVRNVAVFAKAHYPSAAKLDDISVGFSQVSGVGPVSFTSSEAPVTFKIADLK